MVLHHRGFPIRKSAGRWIFPPRRGLSQVIASFIGSQCQGIHLTLFFAWTAVLLFSIIFIRKQIQLFCLSFANNCFGLWISKLLCNLTSHRVSDYSKDLFGFIIHVSCPPEEYIYSPSDEIVLKFFQLHPLVYGKTFKNNFLTSFSQYTTICFVSLYFIRFSMSICFELFWVLVEMMGFEPMTPCLQGRCSPSWATPPFVVWVSSIFTFW